MFKYGCFVLIKKMIIVIVIKNSALDHSYQNEKLC